jgi:PhnB protein
MQANIYLNFNGDCEEAFRFYEKTFGAKIEAMGRFEGSPAAGQVPADWRKKIIHAWLMVGNTMILASDAPPERYEQPKGMNVSLSVDTPGEAEQIFADLSEKGSVRMPMAQTFFARRFGMVVDRFGIPWMVICQSEA